MSIVVTAVYILRAIGQTVMGPLQTGFETIKDAAWNEKLAAIVLLGGIFTMGLAPHWLNALIGPAAQVIMERLAGK